MNAFLASSMSLSFRLGLPSAVRVEFGFELEIRLELATQEKFLVGSKFETTVIGFSTCEYNLETYLAGNDLDNQNRGGNGKHSPDAVDVTSGNDGEDNGRSKEGSSCGDDGGGRGGDDDDDDDDDDEADDDRDDEEDEEDDNNDECTDISSKRLKNDFMG